MTDQIAGVCPVCNVEIMRPWHNSSQAFGRQTLIHFACLATWNRVIGAWHTELADRPAVEQEQTAEAERDAVVKDSIKAALAWKAESAAACNAACDAIRAKTIEECAQVADGWDFGKPIAKDIRALAQMGRIGEVHMSDIVELRRRLKAHTFHWGSIEETKAAVMALLAELECKDAEIERLKRMEDYARAQGVQFPGRMGGLFG